MSGDVSRAPFEAFFLHAGSGERFCIFHPANGAPLGSILYVHPFAEEMNKSRRMAAQQARAFRARGYSVLQIDLQGCGDSGGDFGEARWELWHDDLALAAAWLATHADGPVHLWGLRLGALLAADHLRQAPHSFAGLLLWQPVISGTQFMTQFLRFRLGAEMLSGAAAGKGTEQLRAQLAAGAALEIAGYELAPPLASAIERLDLAALAPGTCRHAGSKSTPRASRLPVCSARRARGARAAPRSNCTPCAASRSGAPSRLPSARTSSPPLRTQWT